MIQKDDYAIVGLDESRLSSKVLRIPSDIEELHIDLRKEQLMKVVGSKGKGEIITYILKITRKGRLTLV